MKKTRLGKDLKQIRASNGGPGESRGDDESTLELVLTRRDHERGNQTAPTAAQFYSLQRSQGCRCQ